AKKYALRELPVSAPPRAISRCEASSQRLRYKVVCEDSEAIASETPLRRATTDTLARGVSSTIRTLSSCHRSVQHTGRADLVTAQAGDEGRGLAVAPGCLADQPRALAAAAPCPNHFSVGSGFIDEDQLSCIKTGLLGFPLQARFGDV